MRRSGPGGASRSPIRGDHGATPGQSRLATSPSLTQAHSASVRPWREQGVLPHGCATVRITSAGHAAKRGPIPPAPDGAGGCRRSTRPAAGGCGRRADAAGLVHGTEQRPGSVATVTEPLLEVAAAAPAQVHGPLLVALAVPNDDRAILGLEVVDLEPGELTSSDPASVEDREHGGVAGCRDVGIPRGGIPDGAGCEESRSVLGAWGSPGRGGPRGIV